MRTCEECQRNKASNQKPSGLLQPLEIPTHRWERVSMDFVTHLPETSKTLRCIDGGGGLPHQDAHPGTYIQLGNSSGHCKILRGCSGKKTRSAKSHSIRQGYKVYEYILAGGPKDDGDYAGDVIRLSSADGWADRTCK